MTDNQEQKKQPTVADKVVDRQKNIAKREVQYGVNRLEQSIWRKLLRLIGLR